MQAQPTILIVDDDPLGRRVLEAQLFNQGYRLVMAQGGLQALALASEQPPDLILLDLMMPGIDGLETCRRLRSDACLKEVPVIMITAMDDQEAWAAGIEAGADDFMSKPYKRTMLLYRVRTFIRLSGYRRLYEEQRKRNEHSMEAGGQPPLEYQRQAALAKLELSINQPHELQETLDQVVKNVTELLPASLGASLVLWDEEHAVFTVSATTVPEQEKTFPAKQVRRSGDASRWIVDNRRPFVEPDTAKPTISVNTMIADYGVKAYAGMPLLDADQCLGILYALEDQQRSFTEEDLQFLQGAADRAAVAVGKVQAYEKLMRANAELARSSRMKDEFLANMSHELRTPLNTILNFTEALLEEVYGPVTSMQIRSLDSITDSSQHLLELITDILDLSKIEAGKMTLHVEPVDVRSVCESSMRMVQQTAQTKGQQLDLQIDPACEWVPADVRRMRQILVNLLINAVKFTNPSGKIGLEVSLNDARDRMLFCVWDTGIGIAHEDLTRLFQSFVQLDGGLARPQSGTGLGLALVKHMVGLHQGMVSVESEVGQGSRFTIALPLVSTELAWASRPDNVKSDAAIEYSMPTGGHSVLLAEDNQVNAFALSTYLESKGYQMYLATNGAEAVTIAKELSPDIILMNIQMPVMTGLEAIKHIRDLNRRVRTPILAITAFAMEDDMRACLAAGADAYMAKPLRLESLVAKMAELLELERSWVE